MKGQDLYELRMVVSEAEFGSDLRGERTFRNPATTPFLLRLCVQIV